MFVWMNKAWFVRYICVFGQMLPLNTNIRLAYANGKDDEQNFIQNLSLFLCTFLKEHGQLIEKRPNLRETLMEVGGKDKSFPFELVSL